MKQDTAINSNTPAIDSIKWWHQIDLGNGVVTPGRDKTFAKIKRIQMPADLSGKSVLDIAAWDGAFSFEAERRGARRVVALDSTQYRDAGWEGFDYAKQALNSRVEKLDMDLSLLSPGSVGTFDVVFCLGLLYHLPNPVSTMQQIAAVTSEMMILETHTDLEFCRRPAAAFYPGVELRGDASNWWGFNTEGVRALLRSLGFRSVKVVDRYSLLRRIGIAARDRSAKAINYGRIVVHAHR